MIHTLPRPEQPSKVILKSTTSGTRSNEDVGATSGKSRSMRKTPPGKHIDQVWLIIRIQKFMTNAFMRRLCVIMVEKLP